jgi:hypothetical protein
MSLCRLTWTAIAFLSGHRVLGRTMQTNEWTVRYRTDDWCQREQYSFTYSTMINWAPAAHRWPLESKRAFAC